MANRRTTLTGCYWATEIYPDSAIAGWEDKLASQGLSFFVSPLHDMDKFDDGKPKKPHYHVMFVFNGKKTISTIERYCTQVGAVGQVLIDNPKGYAQYLTHANEDESKYHYDPAGVRSFGGIDYDVFLADGETDLEVLSHVVQFIEDNDINSFYRLSLYCMKYDKRMLDVISGKKGYFIREFIKSRIFDRQDSEGRPTPAQEVEEWEWKKQEKKRQAQQS